jgi:50S ribosomal subunit-associated GTPase HflX
MRYHLSSDLEVTVPNNCDLGDSWNRDTILEGVFVRPENYLTLDRALAIAKVDNVSKGKAKHHQDVTASQLMQEGFGQPISFSAKTGQGKQELWKAIEEKVRSAYNAQSFVLSREVKSTVSDSQ